MSPVESMPVALTKRHVNNVRKEQLAAKLWSILRRLMVHPSNHGYFNVPVDWRKNIGLGLVLGLFTGLLGLLEVLRLLGL